MKKIRTMMAVLMLSGLAATAQNTPTSQMEKLGRGLVALPAADGQVFLSWRLLGTDATATVFDVYKNGKPTELKNLSVTNTTLKASPQDKLQVVAKVKGKETDRSKPVAAWSQPYLRIAVDRPEGGVSPTWTTRIPKTRRDTVEYNRPYSYLPNDCSVGDVDGDGEYELILKWDPTASQDNSFSHGHTGNVILDCYKVDWNNSIVNGKSSNSKLLWRIDLGPNIRAGAHYTQYLVYDFDQDGRAELMLKTAPGSKDGKGRYVNQAATDAAIKSADNQKDWRSDNGRIRGGQEYLTVFNGLTGEAIHTIAYMPNREGKPELSDAMGTRNWDHRKGKRDIAGGNRSERHLAAAAWLDGPKGKVSGIFSRGYYQYAYVWAVDFDGKQLKHRWLNASDSKTEYTLYDRNMKATTLSGKTPTGHAEGSGTMYGNGNHNLSIADVDGDGKDEIIWGAACCDDDGTVLYATGFGHGDAIHVSDLDPDRPGLEVFDIHEDKPAEGCWDIHDARTGEVLQVGGGQRDNGRGLAADIYPQRGFEFWSGYGGYSLDVKQRTQKPINIQTREPVGNHRHSMNFRLYWDGDEYDELLGGPRITKPQAEGKEDIVLGVNGTPLADMGHSVACNSTKGTPCLSADILGDWREEVILWDSSDSCHLNVFTTTIPTEHRVPTLMHDHVYRMGIVWQNVGYNQPPHLSYYLPDALNRKNKKQKK